MADNKKRPEPGTRCRGERRYCHNTAVGIKQGRALCQECIDIRKANRNRRNQRVRRNRAPEHCAEALKLLKGQRRAIVAAMHRVDKEADPDAGSDSLAWVLEALEDIVTRGLDGARG